MQPTSSLTLACGSVAFSGSDHPNQMKFRGLLVPLDSPSNKAPNGSEGHRIYVPSGIAEKRLGTLVGMGLNYEPKSLSGHAQRHKVGTIQKAYIKGSDLWVEGVVWKHDFPEAEKDLKQPGLGMSMELGEVKVEDQSADVWRLKDFCFLGATILFKDKAAYNRTQAIAAKADEGRITMIEKKKTKTAVEPPNTEKIVELAASAAVSAVSESITPTLQKLIKAVGKQSARLDEMELDMIASGVKTVDSCDKGVKAAKKKKDDPDDDEDDDSEDSDDDDDKEDDDDDMDSEAIDEGDLEELGPDLGDGDDEGAKPGDLSKGAVNKGGKQTSEDKLGGKATEGGGVTGSGCMKANRKLAAMVATLSASVAALEKRLGKQSKQLKAAGDATDRRSREMNASTKAALDPTSAGLLSKAGLDPLEMQASGQVMTADQADAVLASSGLNLGITERIQAKNNWRNAGLMQ